MGEIQLCKRCRVRVLITGCERQSSICNGCDLESIESEHARGRDTTTRLRCGLCDSVLFTAEEESAQLCHSCLSKPGGQLP
jgi:hypothetical protein